MDEIVAKAGMSSSTVYRYFPEGKSSLVRTVIGRVMDPVVDWIAELAEVDELPSFEDVFVTAVERSWVFGRPFSGEADASPEAESSESPESAVATEASDQIDLMVGVWAELARRPDLREVYADSYLRVRGEVARVVRQWQGRGIIAGGIDPDEAAAVIHNAAVGLIIQRTVTGEFGRADAAMTAHAVMRLLGI
jgi:transcriptional regulator, TetR family